MEFHGLLLDIVLLRLPFSVKRGYHPLVEYQPVLSSPSSAIGRLDRAHRVPSESASERLVQCPLSMARQEYSRTR
jgi:hypothetical protein